MVRHPRRHSLNQNQQADKHSMSASSALQPGRTADGGTPGLHAEGVTARTCAPQRFCVQAQAGSHHRCCASEAVVKKALPAWALFRDQCF